MAEDRSADDHIRYAAAKSLAELGEGSALRLLYPALISDGHMNRYLAHLGCLAVSGKSQDDFEGYRYGRRVNRQGRQRVHTRVRCGE